MRRDAKASAEILVASKCKTHVSPYLSCAFGARHERCAEILGASLEKSPKADCLKHNSKGYLKKALVSPKVTHVLKYRRYL